MHIQSINHTILMNQHFDEWWDQLLSSINDADSFNQMKSELYDQLISLQIHQTLTNEFAHHTNKFINELSPKLIIEILHIKPNDSTYSHNLNQVLEHYINLIPIFYFSDHTKFLKFANKIITDKTYPFYASTMPTAFSFYDSTYFSSNVNSFINSDFLNQCEIYLQSIDSNYESTLCNNFHRIIDSIDSFSSKWDKQKLCHFLEIYNSIFFKYIDNIKDFRNLNENQILSIFDILKNLNDGNSELLTTIKDKKMDFCILMLKSDFLNKQFAAIELLQSDQDATLTIYERIEKEGILTKITKNIHKELFSGYLSLLIKMVNSRCASPEYLFELWDSMITNSLNCIDDWSKILGSLHSQFVDLFWEKLAKSHTFPVYVYSFLQENYYKTDDTHKKMMFQCLLQQLFSNQNEEIDHEINQTILFFIPNDIEFRLSVRDQCLDFIKNELHVEFSLNLLKKLSIRYNSDESRQLFENFLDINPDVSKYPNDYFDLFTSLVRKFDSTLIDKESVILQKLLICLITEKRDQIQNFFDDVTSNGKNILPESFYSDFIDFILDNADEQYVDLLIFFFKESNKQLFKSKVLFSDIWISSTSNLCCEDEIWQFLYKTSSLKLAHFLCKLYTNCNDQISLERFATFCLKRPICNGALIALSESIKQRESSIYKIDDSNKWSKFDMKITNNLVKVELTGDITQTLILPSEINSQQLKSIISELFVIRPEFFSLSLDSKVLPNDVFILKSSSILNIQLYMNEFQVPSTPTQFITPEETEFLFSLLTSNELSSTVYDIVSYLPTINKEIDLLNTINSDNFTSILNSDHLSILKYRLNALGNLLETNWPQSFFNETFLKSFYEELIINQKLYHDDQTIFFIIKYLSDSNSNLFSFFEVNDFEKLLCLIFEETNNEVNCVNLFEILKNASFKSVAKLISSPSINSFCSQFFFCENVIFRTTLCSIFSFKNHKGFLIQFLSQSNSPFCRNYLDLLETMIKEDENDFELFEKATNLLITSFDHQKETKEILFSNPPNEEFLIGMISLLFKLKKSINSDQVCQKLLSFLIQKVLLSSTFYIPLSSITFSLIECLSDFSEDNNQILIDNLISIHNSVDGSQQQQTISFHSTNQRKGLKNLGATCYLNSILQQLFNIEEFRNRLLAQDSKLEKKKRTENQNEKIHQDDSQTNDNNQDEQTVDDNNQLITDSNHQDEQKVDYYDYELDWVYQLQMVFARLLFYPSSFVSTQSFFSLWKGWDDVLMNPREQQDAVEFLQLILDRLDTKYENLIDVFKGKILHETIGVNTDYECKSEEEFTTLPLDVCDANDFMSSLRIFLRAEVHHDYKAEGYGTIEVQRSHSFMKLPKVLIIQLKRFAYDLKTYTRMKLDKKFEFNEQIILHENSNKEIEYELVGVVVHIGSSLGGHYYSYIKPNSDQWIVCNDSLVKSFDGKDITKKVAGGISNAETAYILFYRQKQIKFEIDLNMNEKVLVKLSKEISQNLRYSVLTNPLYTKFVLQICDDYQSKKGRLLLDYFVKFMRNSNQKELIQSIETNLISFIEKVDSFSNDFVNDFKEHQIMLLDNHNQYTRHVYSQLLCRAMDKANSDDLVAFIISKLPDSLSFWENYDEFFLPLLKFASIPTSTNIDIINPLFKFLQDDIITFQQKEKIAFFYQKVNLSNVFKLLTVILHPQSLKEEYKTIIFSEQFLKKWIQSPLHSVSLSQLLRSFVVQIPDLSTTYFTFLTENATNLMPESFAGHFLVLFNPQMKDNDNQIEWCLNFLIPQTAFYIQAFFDSLTTKTVESQIDLTSSLIKFSDIWIDHWLFSEAIEERKSIRKFIASSFKHFHSDLLQLFDILILKIPDLIRITSYRNKTNILNFDIVSPTNVFYSLLLWVIIEGHLESQLSLHSHLFIDALYSHSNLQSRNNTAQQRLMEIIVQASAISFMTIDNLSTFLSSFRNIDTSIEANRIMLFQAIQFARSGYTNETNSLNEIIKSKAFHKLVVAELTNNLHNTKQLDSSLMFKSASFQILTPPVLSLYDENFFDFVGGISLNETAPCLSNVLFNSQFHECFANPDFVLIVQTLFDLPNNYFTLSSFVKHKCHLYLINEMKKSSNLSNCFVLLRKFNDLYAKFYYGQTFYYFWDAYKPLISIWTQNLAMIDDVISKALKSTEVGFCDSAFSLLRSICFIDDSLLESIFMCLKGKKRILVEANELNRRSAFAFVDFISDLLLKKKLLIDQVVDFLNHEIKSMTESKISDDLILQNLERKKSRI